MKKIFITCMALAMTFLMQQEANACTGITLTAKDSARIVARTIEWGGSELNSQYVVVPRGYVQHSYVPGYTLDGMKMVARYGYVGLSVEQKEFVVEGLNEAGLSAGLFYFPGYGQYEAYNRFVDIGQLRQRGAGEGGCGQGTCHRDRSACFDRSLEVC